MKKWIKLGVVTSRDMGLVTGVTVYQYQFSSIMGHSLPKKELKLIEVGAEEKFC